MKRFKSFSKLLLILLSIAAFVVITIFILLIIILVINSPKVIKNINQYNECLYLIKNKDEIKHFPQKITVDEKHANLYCLPANIGNYELVLLMLKTDKDYVEQELKSHSFLNPDTKIGSKQKIYHMPSKVVGISNEDLTYYVLNKKGNYNENTEYFPYFTGVGISKDMNYILYYYISPD